VAPYLRYGVAQIHVTIRAQAYAIWCTVGLHAIATHAVRSLAAFVGISFEVDVSALISLELCVFLAMDVIDNISAHRRPVSDRLGQAFSF
jgi:hypothetical protein